MQLSVTSEAYKYKYKYLLTFLRPEGRTTW